MIHISNIVMMLRLLAKTSKGNTVLLPVEIVDIVEGKHEEKHFKNIDIDVVLKYLASMMEE